MPDPGQLVIVSNPDRGSSLGHLLRLPIAGGLVFRTAGTWPRTKALFCYPVPPDAWPDDGEVVERVPLCSCVRRGAAIEVVADRARENRSRLVFTTARGRDVVFWQSPRTRKQAPPKVALPSARAGGLADLEVIVDTRERYPYRFAGQAVSVCPGRCPVATMASWPAAGSSPRWNASPSPISSAASSTGSSGMRGRPGRPAPRCSGVRGPLLGVVQTASRPTRRRRRRPGRVPDPVAHHPGRVLRDPALAEEWTYRYLAAAWSWAATEPAAQERTTSRDPLLLSAPEPPEPTVAEERA